MVIVAPPHRGHCCSELTPLLSLSLVITVPLTRPQPDNFDNPTFSTFFTSFHIRAAAGCCLHMLIFSTGAIRTLIKDLWEAHVMVPAPAPGGGVPGVLAIVWPPGVLQEVSWPLSPPNCPPPGSSLRLLLRRSGEPGPRPGPPGVDSTHTLHRGCGVFTIMEKAHTTILHTWLHEPLLTQHASPLYDL